MRKFKSHRPLPWDRIVVLTLLTATCAAAGVLGGTWLVVCCLVAFLLGLAS